MEDASKRSQYQVDEIGEVFSCDCGTHDHSLSATLESGGHYLTLEMSDQKWFNRPWYECFWGGLQAFWEVFWHHEQSIEISLNRQEHKKWKLFFSQLVDDRCWNCDPDFAKLVHSHGKK